MARRHGVKVILKPCNQPRLSDELLQCVDYLIPNKLELQEICPDGDTLEDKVRILQSRGADTVIVTLSAEGCMLAQREQAPGGRRAHGGYHRRVRRIRRRPGCVLHARRIAAYRAGAGQLRGRSVHRAAGRAARAA